MVRRRFLTTASAALCLSRGSSAHSEDEPLCVTAARSGRYFGAALRIQDIERENDLRGAVLRECAHITPETALKWDAVEPGPGTFAFEPMDRLLAFAQTHGMSVHGHTLLWHGGMPRWAERALADTRDWRLVERYFDAVLARYQDTISQWDVVNEPIETGYRMDGLRGSVFLKAFGPDYIPRALWEARRRAPKAKLMINEFALEYDTKVDSDRRYHFLKMLERLKRANVPLDGIGLQSHLDLAKGPFPAETFARFVQTIAEFGLFIVVSELDVKEYEYTAAVEERDRLAADATARYLDVLLACSAVQSVTCWGMSDRHSWLKVKPEDLARHPGAWKDHSGPGVNRGLPFDTSMRRKPMYHAIARALRTAPTTTAR
jgi:endo-1,4-beta-xylanase